jgi:hypothetical protein
VIGDGCFSALKGDAYGAMSRSLRRVVRRGGLVLMRFFTRPDASESPASVLADLRAGRIGSFHAFKWRLAMALHGSLDAGVRLGDIWDTWRDAVPDPRGIGTTARLAAARSADHRRLSRCRGALHLPTLSEARAAMAAEFEEVSCHFPRYELGERCPILAFGPR